MPLELETVTAAELSQWPEETKKEFQAKLETLRESLNARPDLVKLCRASPPQLELVNAQERVVALLGSNQCGKTTGQCLKVNHIALTEPGTIQWMLDVNFTQSLDSQQKAYDEILPRSFVREGDFSPLRGFRNQAIQYENGSIVRFMSYESGWEPRQGGQRIRTVNFNEHPKERGAYEEALMRTIGHPKGQVTLAFTALQGYNWVYHEIWNKGAKWIKLIHSVMRDNAGNLPPGRIEQQEEIFRGTPMYAARILGQWVAMGGTCAFDQNALTEMFAKAQEPARYDLAMLGHLQSVARRDDTGTLFVWKEPDPDRQYAIGVDTATGTGAHDSALSLIDVNSMEVVATYCEDVPPDVLAEKAAALGLWYNTADIVCERNGIGEVTLQGLQRLQYPRIWKDRSGETPKPGWFSSDIRRRQLVADLQNAVRERYITIWDRRLLDQMSMFVLTDNNRAQAQEGAKDDMVLALAMSVLGATTRGAMAAGRSPRDVIMSPAMANREKPRVLMGW